VARHHGEKAKPSLFSKTSGVQRGDPAEPLTSPTTSLQQASRPTNLPREAMLGWEHRLHAGENRKGIRISRFRRHSSHEIENLSLAARMGAKSATPSYSNSPPRGLSQLSANERLSGFFLSPANKQQVDAAEKKRVTPPLQSRKGKKAILTPAAVRSPGLLLFLLHALRPFPLFPLANKARF